MSNPSGRRVKVLKVTGEFLVGHFKMLRGGRVAMRAYELPRDVKYAGICGLEKAGVVGLLLESSEWEPVPEGGEIPEVKVEVVMAMLPPGIQVERPGPRTLLKNP